jgi:hypothetical protein
MAQRAGIALGRIAPQADFSMTKVDGAPAPPTYSTPTRHKLTDETDVKDIINTFDAAVGFDTKPFDNGFAIAYPISASSDQRQAFYKDNLYSHDHFHAWVNKHANRVGKEQRNVNFLFIDLTPGQVASKLCNGNTDSKRWTYNFKGDQFTNLGEVESLTAQDLVDKLVPQRKINRVAILRPEGAFPELSSADVEAKFPDIPLKWVTLDVISRGAAFIMHEQETLADESEYNYEFLG